MAEAEKRGVLSRVAILRLLAFFFLPMAVYGTVAFTFLSIVKHLPPQFQDAFRIAGALVASALVVGTYLILTAKMERRSAKELAPLRAPGLLIAGMVIAFVMFCAVYGVLAGMGDASWHGIIGYTHVASFAAMAIASGVSEEIVFRGGFYRILEDAFGSGVALALSAAVFGAMHLINPHANLFSALAIAIEAGILLGAAYAATRSLWLPIGIHIGWNFTEGGVFGAAVSGGKPGQGIFDVPLNGPDLITGGAFGPEASVVTMAVCLLIGTYYIVRTVKRGRWVPLSFHMLLD